MSLKAQIIKRLKDKFPGVNLSTTRINAIAERLDKIVKEETEIDDQLDAADAIMDFAAIAKEDDKIRTELAKAKAPATKTDDPPPADPPKQDDETPAWAKKQSETIEALLKKVNALETGKTSDTRKTIAQEKLKELHPDFVASTMADLDLLNFETDEAFTTWLDRKATEGGKITQTAANDAISGNGRPIKGATPPDGKGKASKEELDAVMENL